MAKQGSLTTGKAVITTGGNLPAKYVIHTVGPVRRGGTNNESQLLSSAYKESLKLAKENKISRIELIPNVNIKLGCLAPYWWQV